MKIIVHFTKDGPSVQKIVEELLLECCIVNY